jgi:hypothetical protein
MDGIPVPIGDIISKGAGIVTTRTDVMDNFFSNNTKKDILKKPNKYDFRVIIFYIFFYLVVFFIFV